MFLLYQCLHGTASIRSASFCARVPGLDRPGTSMSARHDREIQPRFRRVSITKRPPAVDFPTIGGLFCITIANDTQGDDSCSRPLLSVRWLPPRMAARYSKAGLPYCMRSMTAGEQVDHSGHATEIPGCFSVPFPGNLPGAVFRRIPGSLLVPKGEQAFLWGKALTSSSFCRAAPAPAGRFFSPTRRHSPLGCHRCPPPGGRG